MRRYLSISKRNSTYSAALESVNEKGHNHEDDMASSTGGADGNASTAALLTPSVPLPPPNFKVKRLDYYYSRWSKSWKYKNMGEKVTLEMAPVGGTSGTNDPWQSYCFVVIRTISRKDEDTTFQVVIKSPYLLQACKTVIQEVPGISWNADPLQASVPQPSPM